MPIATSVNTQGGNLANGDPDRTQARSFAHGEAQHVAPLRAQSDAYSDPARTLRHRIPDQAVHPGHGDDHRRAKLPIKKDGKRLRNTFEEYKHLVGLRGGTLATDEHR